MPSNQARGADKPRVPNIVLIITDDQGYGDIGIHGNPKIATPNLDRLAKDGVQFSAFQVCPVCSPTRASLMTGRYNYRTGVVDTFIGRSLMHPDEVTLPQALAAADYRTGIFGKWHLGDNYPMRPMDRGFQESLVLKGGGLGQPSDPPGTGSYFDPPLLRNGKWEKSKGYVSDVITDGAVKFIEDNKDRPFFVYLAFNAPHAPLQLPEKKLEKYKKMDLSLDQFPRIGHGIAGKYDPDSVAKVYGMVENIDDNIGRLLARLDELKLAKDTIVIFLTDNGPAIPSYNAGMRQRKGSVYDGGIRVPFFVRWPGKFEAGRKIDRIAAHIDVMPTLLDLCGAAHPEKVKFDGTSLAPLLRGDKANWPDRTLHVQWHRGDVPELYRACAARSQRYKLVQAQGVAEGKGPLKPEFQLFDMAADPLEEKDVARDHPEMVAKLKQGYEAWFKDVTSARDFKVPPRIYLGAPQEELTQLTRQDWRGPQAGWGARSAGYWEVRVDRAGTYEVTLRFPKLAAAGKAQFMLGDTKAEKDVAIGDTEVTFGQVKLAKGDGRLEAAILQGQDKAGPHYVDVRRVE